MEKFDHILLFKTNIKFESDRLKLKLELDRHECIEKWNVDLQDEDYVLRIISHQLKHDQIIRLINKHGYECCELK